MRCLVCVLLVLALICSIAGCARTRRITNDIGWVVFDGEPSKEN